MPTINECKIQNYLNKTELNFQQNTGVQIKANQKVADYFGYIYSYPPKIQVKWDGLDDLDGNLSLGKNSSAIEYSDFVNDWFFAETSKEAIAEKYSSSQYFNGFFDKLNSSNFFLKKTKKIQTALSSVPIFVILNGQGEVVLSRPGNVLNPNSVGNYVNEKVYDSCGAFDPTVEKKGALGLFFMTRLDAENYLKEVARADFEGTETLGLSIHCVNLSTAYKITREYHPGIDFRFVPNLKELKNLLVNKVGKSDMMVEEEQQQIRFRPRISNLLSPSSSNEYFKGVPIYVVQLKNKPRNLFYEHVTGYLDTIYHGCLESLDSTIGFGHNWIMQGSLQNVKASDKFENYIFFEKDQAVDFTKKWGRYVSRYEGGRSSNLEFAFRKFTLRKPKVFVYNLEDFIEDWEDQLLADVLGNVENGSSFFTAKETNFISPSLVFSGIQDLETEKTEFQKSFLEKAAQTLNIKAKVLKRTTGIFFNTN
tara:strand:+ start:5639 stop:7075 length:1437 start_codon:yes stop_codon:yes gene_type:complete